MGGGRASVRGSGRGISLTKAERRVLEALAGGCDAREVADVLGISRAMVERHIVELCVKAFPTCLSLRSAFCGKLLS